MALRWKKNDRPTGLAAVGCGPRGSKLHDGEQVYAHVYALRRIRATEGWYWVARNDVKGVPRKNTCYDPVADEATAKADAMAYVKACLNRHAASPTGEKSQEGGEHA